ncbi:MAG: hypothetical protein WC114_06275 [Smithellaceae bacterium]|jgi:hypothetical protein
MRQTFKDANESTIEQAAMAWQAAKDAEKEAQQARREIEDWLGDQIGLPEDFDKTVSIEEAGYKFKATGRLNRRVDGEKLQHLAIENGLVAHVEELFRAKYELNLTAWKNADESITEKLAEAITTTPGRPSFEITKIEEKH